MYIYIYIYIYMHVCNFFSGPALIMKNTSLKPLSQTTTCLPTYEKLPTTQVLLLLLLSRTTTILLKL